MAEQTAPSIPHGIRFANSEGELGVLSGRVNPMSPFTLVPQNWTQRVHPFRGVWLTDELKQRASYLATKQHLGPFLVPHRFEGTTEPTKLNRAGLGYGVGLNKSYVNEILGHIRGTPAHYTWGPLSNDKSDTMDPPSGEPAESLWFDATGSGVSWTNFLEGRVLEWMLTSVGGFILIDSNRPPGQPLSQAAAALLGIRARLRWIPFSWVEDFGRSDTGYRWIKFAETADEREPEMEGLDDTGFFKRHVLYELLPDGFTRIRRFDDDANQIGDTVFQNIRDIDGRGILPMIEANLGEHPDLSFLGSGMLMGLDDIEIDLYNLLTEIREAFRDAAFSFLSYRGTDFDGVHSMMEQGTRLVDLGDDPHTQLDRIGADGSEVTSGLGLFELGLKNWSLSAKRRAMEIVEASTSRSGISLKAEFQLDLRPLLVIITEALDLVETNTMFVLAQMEGATPEEANEVVIKREVEFQLEQEASRITRIAEEYLEALPAIPQSVAKRLIVRWAESLGFLKLDEPEEGDSGRTLREAVEEEAAEIAESSQKSIVLQNEFPLAPGTPTVPSEPVPVPGQGGGGEET